MATLTSNFGSWLTSWQNAKSKIKTWDFLKRRFKKDETLVLQSVILQMFLSRNSRPGMAQAPPFFQHFREMNWLLKQSYLRIFELVRQTDFQTFHVHPKCSVWFESEKFFWCSDISNIANKAIGGEKVNLKARKSSPTSRSLMRSLLWTSQSFEIDQFVEQKACSTFKNSASRLVKRLGSHMKKLRNDYTCHSDLTQASKNYRIIASLCKSSCWRSSEPKNSQKNLNVFGKSLWIWKLWWQFSGRAIFRSRESLNFQDQSPKCLPKIHGFKRQLLLSGNDLWNHRNACGVNSGNLVENESFFGQKPFTEWEQFFTDQIILLE